MMINAEHLTDEQMAEEIIQAAMGGDQYAREVLKTWLLDDVEALREEHKNVFYYPK